MQVNGRDKPVATITTDGDGEFATIRIDFKLNLTEWVEIRLTHGELLALARQLDEEAST